MLSTLFSNAGRVCTYAAADFELQIGFQVKLSTAADEIKAKQQWKHWAMSGTRYLLREPEEQRLLTLAAGRVGFQTLGLTQWEKALPVCSNAFAIALQHLGVVELKRIGFKLLAFLPVQMKHSEICDLMFDCFLVSKEKLEPILGKNDDVLLQLHSEQRGIKLIVIMAPMTAEQVVQSLGSMGDLELFLESKLYDTRVLDFRKQVESDCFFCDVDAFKNGPIPVSGIEAFFKDSLQVIDKVVEAAVDRLKSKPNKQRAS